MQFSQSIPIYILFVIAAIGFLLFAGFKLYRTYVLPIISLKEDGPVWQQSFVKIEIVAWVMFFTILVYIALKANLVISFTMLLLILFAFFDFWRNYFAGVAIKFANSFQVGDSITINDIEGKVIDFGYRSLKLVTKKGEEIQIPYRLVNTTLKIEQKRIPTVLLKTFEIENHQNEYSNFKQKIREAIYMNPWIIISSPINISIENQKAHLSFYVLNAEFFEKAKMRLYEDLLR